MPRQKVLSRFKVLPMEAKIDRFWLIRQAMISLHQASGNVYRALVEGDLIIADLRNDRYLMVPEVGRALLDDDNKATEDGALLHRLSRAQDNSPLQQTEYCGNTSTYLTLTHDILWLYTKAIRYFILRKTGKIGLAIKGPTPKGGHSEMPSLPQLEMIAGAFNAARYFLPIKRVCLLDAILMRDFLASKGVDSRVFLGYSVGTGVFHAWVQAGRVLIGERLTYIKTLTLIAAI